MNQNILFSSTEVYLKDLMEHGLIIPNQKRALHNLNFIGVYRFDTYNKPFYINKDKFNSETEFDSILELYTFDSKLRSLIMEPLEIIEIALRTTISNVMSKKHNPYWFHEPSCFSNPKSWCLIRKDIEREVKRDNKHGDKLLNNPHSYKIAEIMTFGFWSKILSNLKATYKKEISESILGNKEINYKIFCSWIYSLSVLRNWCVHHVRLWNHDMNTAKPSIPNNCNYFNQLKRDSLYFRLFIIQKFLDNILPQSEWKNRLQELIKKYNEKMPFDVAKKIGFPPNSTEWFAI